MSASVTEFLSPTWLAAMADAARGDRRAAAPADGARPDLVIQQVVTGADHEVTWFVSVRAAEVCLQAGRHPAPDITLTQDRATAAAIASGAQSAQGAFMSGRLRVGGDVRILLDHQDELARLDDLFAPVRAATSYPEEG
jgi:predicted lipid carrier protein YhbT